LGEGFDRFLNGLSLAVRANIYGLDHSRELRSVAALNGLEEDPDLAQSQVF